VGENGAVRLQRVLAVRTGDVRKIYSKWSVRICLSKPSKRRGIYRRFALFSLVEKWRNQRDLSRVPYAAEKAL
jgi:hypothetical protein